MSETNYLFVYGTLLNKANNDMSQFLGQHAMLVGKGYFYGELYLVDWYPGAVKSKQATDKVYGTIYKISEANLVFKVLDDYEGVQEGLYDRVLMDVFIDADTVLNCWVYLYSQPTSNLKRIDSGDFFKL
ncbi:gamma-glutamylcyclotransferase family protein [Aestuariivivens insulae]|uniref:gamma-glutamylcyclotransferase family protein n=1 Tax=Aestuariivivens insulae TaxID=1621988 RepID=UPI001F58F06A|nr:gamma-glutamylcyclotransferase family protein [Aestuariivivens insulae]